MHNKKKIAIFDLDYTILKIDTTQIYVKEIIKIYPLYLFYIPKIIIYGILNILNIVSRTRLKEILYAPIRKLSEEQIKELAENITKKSILKIKKEALEHIKDLQKEEYEIILASASPEFYIKEIAEFLKIKYFVGTKVDITEREVKITGLNCKSEEKVKRIKEIIDLSTIDLENSRAYSDSYSDMPILTLVGKGHMVHRKKWRFKKWKRKEMEIKNQKEEISVIEEEKL
ncbi:MAG: HAD family hydrolase [bacterium]